MKTNFTNWKNLKKKVEAAAPGDVVKMPGEMGPPPSGTIFIPEGVTVVLSDPLPLLQIFVPLADTSKLEWWGPKDKGGEAEMTMKERLKKEIENTKQRKNREMDTKIGQFIGALAIHMAIAGGRCDLASLMDEPLGVILEACFKNGISFEIKNEHISDPVFSPIFGQRKEEVMKKGKYMGGGFYESDFEEKDK